MEKGKINERFSKEMNKILIPEIYVDFILFCFRLFYIAKKFKVTKFDELRFTQWSHIQVDFPKLAI